MNNSLDKIIERWFLAMIESIFRDIKVDWYTLTVTMNADDNWIMMGITDSVETRQILLKISKQSYDMCLNHLKGLCSESDKLIEIKNSKRIYFLGSKDE